MIRFLIALGCSFLLLQCSVAQKATNAGVDYMTKKTAEGKALKYYKKGMEYNIKEQNAKAINEFEKALKAAPRFIDAQIQWSGIKYYLKDYAAAEMGFEKALAIDPTYQKKVAYVLGLAELAQQKNEEAIIHLEQYIESKPKNATLLKKASDKLKEVKFTTLALANPVPFEPKSLGEKVNTANPEYLPSLTADGETLVYTMREGGQEDFYVSTKKDGEWQRGTPLTDINTELNEGAQSISADGKFLVFTKCNNRETGYGSCDIYFSEVKNNRWTASANIGSPINSRDWESQPSLSADGKSLYFVSKRRTGKGGSDIWLSTRGEDGSWSTPKMLSDVINTEGDEQSPFIHADGQTLYFASNHHPGMGGYDIFYSRKKEDGSWGRPVNLGYPINTKANEGTLVVSLDGETAYFASDQNLENIESLSDKEIKEGKGMDLYSFELYPAARPQPVTYVKANIVSADTKKPLAARVEIVDLSTGKMHTAADTDTDGQFLVCLPIGKDYALNVAKPKYVFHSEHFALAKSQKADHTYHLNIELNAVPELIVGSSEIPESKLPAYRPTILRNVFFDIGSAILRSESFMELNRLKKLLEDNATIKIQINGHTDNVGTEQDNLTLSENRAKAVYTFLVENGIESGRITYRGYGETKPIDSNETVTGRQINRRTEFVVK